MFVFDFFTIFKKNSKKSIIFDCAKRTQWTLLQLKTLTI